MQSRIMMTSVLVMPVFIAATAAPVQADEAEFVDGALLLQPDVLMREPAQLAAPELPAWNIELPPTVVPPERLEQIRRRASDLNGDGIVDEADVALLRQAFGPCREVPCFGDLNGDGVVDDADEKLLMEQFGQACDSNQPQFEEVGYILPAPPNLVPPLPPQARADGSRAMRLELRSADAIGLRLQFAGFQPAGGLELRVYDPAGTAVLGPYTDPRLDENGAWWAPTIFGDTIGIELTLPPGVAQPAAMPSITSIVYMYCTDPVECHGGPGTALTCHNDITCSATWANNEGRAVAVIYFLTGGSCGRCTGALVNRGPGDFSPLFMTANHCVSTQAQANTLEAFWNYNTPTCNGTPPNFNDVDRTDGALVVKRHTNTDWTLLGLFEPPGANFYIGWSAASWSSGDNATGIHHPRGTFKRISFGSSAGSTDGALFCDANGTVACTGCAGGVTTCIAVDVWDIDYTSGTTEPGSSGSPIFDGNSRMRGTLTGGPAGCAPTTKRYGRFDRAYTNLRYYLGSADVPTPTVFVNGGVSGDPGNNGNTERGTAANPFNSVHEATFCVRSGEEVRVTPGTYNEQMTIWRPMTITRGGSSGIVRIGG